MKEIRVTLDYETRSQIDLKVTGAIEYAKHESTSIFCLGYAINDEPPKLWIPERSPMPSDLANGFLRGTLVAHNSGFERAVTKHVLPRYLASDSLKKVVTTLPPSRWRCTAAKAAQCALPRKLESAAMALDLPTQKDAAGHKLMLKYSKPRKPSKKNPNPWWDDKNELTRIYRYCLTDVQAEYELDQALPDLSEFEQKVWELDQKINDRGVLIDIPLVKLILKLIDEELKQVTEKVQELSLGTIDNATQRAKVLHWVNARGAEMADLKAETIKEKLEDKNLNPRIRSMLEYRQSVSKTSTAKYVSMLNAVGEDHRARELLLYCGTVPTARWSGKRLQPQNMPRPHLKQNDIDKAISGLKTGSLEWVRKSFGDPMKVFATLTRSMLVSSPSKEFFCADFAAVEARLAFWVAEHEEGLEAYRQNRKLYEEMAAETFDMKVGEIPKDSLERFIGKETILGAQYGMGWKKFQDACKNKGKIISDETAKKAVYTYRKVHHPIPALWKNLEYAVVRAIAIPGSRHKLNKVTIYTHGNFLNIKLPSGRRLRYFKPRLSQKQFAGGRMVPEIRYWGMENHQWQECVIWGGIFTNHIVQGIARDLMVNGIFNIENAGYEVVLTIHDEVLAERKLGVGNVSEYILLMTKLPEWAKGAPIVAEGWSGPRYRKG